MRRVVDKVATIVPRAHLEATRHHSYFMALSYICVHSDYVAFFRARSREGKIVILDNSTVELGAPEPFEDYVRKAIDMEASCIVLPDWLHDRAGTYRDAVMGLSTTIGLRFKGQLMGVPQGVNLAEWTSSCKELADLGVGVLGLSYRYNDMFLRNTAVTLATLIAPSVSLHLLGCRANPYHEAAPLLRVPQVRGVDSAFAAAMTKANVLINEETERIEGSSADIMNDEYDPRLLKVNIQRYRELCEGRLIVR